MSDTEADAFEAHPHVTWDISFRKHDNAAKAPGAQKCPLEGY
jgi:hypothetical protein